MSSKGSRVAGTDGSDFEHRETVATRYKNSLKYKSYLKRAIYAHVVLLMVMAVKLANDVIERYDIVIPDVAELAIPPPLVWEYIWFLSFIPAIYGQLSLAHNRLNYLKVLYYGIPLIGILPILAAGGYMFTGFIQYCTTHKTKETFLGLPTVWLWYIFFALALQVHALQVYFAHELRKAWDKSIKSK